MSKPKIYAHCPAGCLWETVHRDEFNNSASIVKVAAGSDGTYSLEKGSRYKIKHEDQNALMWMFTISVGVMWTKDGGDASNTYTLNLPLADPYDALTFCLWDVYRESTGAIIAVYDMNGTRTKQTLVSADEGADEGISILEVTLSAPVGGNLHCWLYNDDATIEAKSAYEIAVDNGFEGTESEWLETLKGEAGSSVVPVLFDLVEAGIGDIVPGGDIVTLEADFTELVKTVYEGRAAIKIPCVAGNGLTLKPDIVINPATATEEDFNAVAPYDMVTYDSVFEMLGKSPKLWIAIYCTTTSITIRCREVDGVVEMKNIPDELYTEIDTRIENYINEALGGDY